MLDLARLPGLSLYFLTIFSLHTVLNWPDGQCAGATPGTPSTPDTPEIRRRYADTPIRQTRICMLRAAGLLRAVPHCAVPCEGPAGALRLSIDESVHTLLAANPPSAKRGPVIHPPSLSSRPLRAVSPAHWQKLRYWPLFETLCVISHLQHPGCQPLSKCCKPVHTANPCLLRSGASVRRKDCWSLTVTHRELCPRLLANPARICGSISQCGSVHLC